MSIVKNRIILEFCDNVLIYLRIRIHDTPSNCTLGHRAAGDVDGLCGGALSSELTAHVELLVAASLPRRKLLSAASTSLASIGSCWVHDPILRPRWHNSVRRISRQQRRRRGQSGRLAGNGLEHQVDSGLQLGIMTGE
jgi:hypothetical protein